MRGARVFWLLLSAAVTAATPGHVFAQSEAKHAIRLLVPVPAGGTTDIVARLIADALRDRLAQTIVVENRPGATGRIAVDAFKKAASDGATLLLAPIAVAVMVPLVFKNPGYDPAKDFAAIAQVAKFEYAFAVAAHHPALTVPEFVAWAGAKSAPANIGNPGAGSVPHLLAVRIGQTAGIELSHVAYKGVGPLAAELIGGQIAAAVSALSDFVALHRAGKLRILATSGAARAPLLPEVPTFHELGYAAVEAVGWHGLYAPAGTPKPAIERLSAAIGAALRSSEVRERFLALGLEPTGTTPHKLAEVMAADGAYWAPIIKASGFTGEP